MLRFTVDEAGLINRLGGNGKEATAANFEKAIQGAEDVYEKKIIGRTARKLSELSEEVCSELVATTKKRKLSERDFSVLYRLSKIRQQRKETENAKEKGRGRKVEKGGMEL